MGSDCVTGMSDGTLVLWKDRCATKYTKAHIGSVMTLCELTEKSSISGGTSSSDGGSGPRVISGGKDGCIHIWSYKLIKIWSLDLGSPDTYPISANAHIRAVSTLENRLLIGTKASEIYEVNLLTGSSSGSGSGSGSGSNGAGGDKNSSATNEIYRLVQGHFEDRAELWALAVHPTSSKFITGTWSEVECWLQHWFLQ